MKRDLGALVRLLQLASPALPVGAYSYSQGLEAAVEAGLVKDAAGAERWIGEVLSLSVASLEAPLLARLMAAFAAGDPAAASRWNDEFLASRESAELRAETVQMGYSLRRLAKELDFGGAASLEPLDEVSFPAAFAAVANAWAIAPEDAVTAYLWAWIENQVMAALKAVPLGQTDGQKLLLRLGNQLESIAGQAIGAEDSALANFAPGLAIASSIHETQYSRLFRS